MKGSDVKSLCRERRTSREVGRVLRPLIFALGLAALLLGRLLTGVPAVAEPAAGSGQNPWVEQSDLSVDDEVGAAGLAGSPEREWARAAPGVEV